MRLSAALRRNRIPFLKKDFRLRASFFGYFWWFWGACRWKQLKSECEGEHEDEAFDAFSVLQLSFGDAEAA